MKKRMIALCLVLVLVLGCITGCGNKKEESQSPNESEQSGQSGQQSNTPAEPEGNLRKTTTSQAENAIRVGLNSDLRTLDIHHSTLANENTIASLIVERLFKMDENKTWGPWLVKSFTPNEDGTVLECEIRDDVYFASGDKMTMEDILYSFERCKVSNSLSTVYQVTRIEEIDDTHFRFLFPVPGFGYYALQDYLGFIPVYNKSFCEQYIDEPTEDLLFKVDGTGPYVLEGELGAGIHDVTLVKRGNYWNEGNYGFLDKIYFKYLTGDAEMAFEAGEVDIAGYRVDDVATAEAFDNVSVVHKTTGFTYIFVLNCSENSPFNDKKVREALYYGFDRETVGMTACGNNGEVAWTFFTPECRNWADVVPHRNLDEDKCKALLAEAGYSTSNPCKITCFTQTSANWIATLEILKEDLDKLGFDCTIEEGAETTRYYSGDFDLAIIGFNLENAFAAYALLLDSTSGLNMAQYTEADGPMIAYEILQATTPEAAKQAMIDFDSTLCYVPLSYAMTYSASDANLDRGPFINGYDLAYAKWIN